VRYATAFAHFWYDFIVGDDWRIAVGIVAALGVTALLASSGIAAWWIMPLVAAALLSLSLWVAVRGEG